MEAVLLIDSSPDAGRLFGRYLQLEGFPVCLAQCEDEAVELMQNNRFRIVICHPHGKDGENRLMLQKLKVTNPGCEIIELTNRSATASDGDGLPLQRMSDWVDRVKEVEAAIGRNRIAGTRRERGDAGPGSWQRSA